MKYLILTAILLMSACGADCECGSTDKLIWRWQWNKYTLARECRPCFEVK